MLHSCGHVGVETRYRHNSCRCTATCARHRRRTLRLKDRCRSIHLHDKCQDVLGIMRIRASSGTTVTTCQVIETIEIPVASAAHGTHTTTDLLDGDPQHRQLQHLEFIFGETGMSTREVEAKRTGR